MARPVPEALQEIVKRIIATAEPDKIILFGSGARGTMGPNSDIDLLVVKPGCFDRARFTGNIYKSLRGVECNVEVIVATPEEIEKYRNSPALVFYPALKEGQVVYDSASAG